MSNIAPNPIYNALDGTSDLNNIEDDTTINGDLTVNGNVTAVSYYGDGSNLTNIAIPANITAQSLTLNNGGTNNFIKVYDNANNTYTQITDNDISVQGGGYPLLIQTKGTTGKVAIGNTNPIAKLHVSDNNSLGEFALFIDQNNSTGLGVGVDVEDTTNSIDALKIRNGGGANTIFTVKANGNVGIKTSTPQSELHITTGSKATYFNPAAPLTGSSLIIENKGVTGTSPDAALLLAGTDTPASISTYGAGRIKGGWETATSSSWNQGALTFQTHANNTGSWTEDMVIRGGNIGINKSQPSQKLHIVGNELIEGKMQITNTTPSTPSRNLEVIGNARISEILVDDNIIESITHYLFIDDCYVNIRGNRSVAGTGKLSVGYTNIVLPSEVLDVNGNIKAVGNITATGVISGPTGTFTNLNGQIITGATGTITNLNATNLTVSGTVNLPSTVTVTNLIATNSVVANNAIQGDTQLIAKKDITFDNIMSSGGTPSTKTLSVIATPTFTKPVTINDSLAIAGTRFSTDYLTAGRGGTGAFFRVFSSTSGSGSGCGVTDNAESSTFIFDNDGNKGIIEHNNNKPIILNQTYSGGVGIGGDPAAYKARVVANASQYAMNITNTNTGASGGLFIDNPSTSSSSVPFYIRCNNNATSAMYVKGSNGWVDMGGTDPITQLEIEQPNGGDICIKDDNIGDYNNMSVQFKTAASPSDFTLGGMHQYISDLRIFGWSGIKFYPGQFSNQNTGFNLTTNSNAFEGTYTAANDKPLIEMDSSNRVRVGYDSSGNTFTATYKLDLGNGATSPHLAIIRSLNVYPRIFEGYYYTTNNIKVLRNTISDNVTATYNGAWQTQIRLYGSSKYGGFMEGSSSGNPIYHYWSALALPQSSGFDYMKLYNATWNIPTIWGSDVNFNFELVRNGSAGHFNFYVRIIFFEGYQGG